MYYLCYIYDIEREIFSKITSTSYHPFSLNELLHLPSNLPIQDTVDCLESSIYNKASDLFGFVLPPK